MTRYRITSELGHGALGRVVRLETDDGRVFAGKLLHASSEGDPRARERFAREAALLGTIDHPNVVRVFERIDLDGHAVMVMELARGPTLAEVLAREGPLAEARLIRLARGIAEGLGAAHRAGIVHRDLKPANVILVDDLPKLVDFGLAQATSLLGLDRTSFALVGTPDYLAPESVDPLAVDARADLYGLGCVLYELIVGRPPYGGATPLAILDAHRRAPIPEVPGVSPGLAALVRALLAKSPVDRPPSASAVVAALDALAGATGSTALVPVAATAVAGPRCHVCGWALVDGVGVCFGCGVPLLRTDSGGVTLFVTGPGSLGDRLDDELRGRLVAWIRATPTLGLDPAPLAKRSFRVPFVLARGLDLEGATALAGALRGLGLEVDAREGGAMALPEMGVKVKTLGKRVAVATGVSMMGGWHFLFSRSRFAVLAVPFVLIAIGVGTWRESTWSATRRSKGGAGPRLLGSALDAVAAVAPSILASRHRDALRGVAQRALELRRGLGSAELDGELAEILALAGHATLRLDALETKLVAHDLREPDAETRALVHERDRLSARLLELTARLDALRVRLASAQARRGTADAADALDALRAEVAALEEITHL